MGFRNPPARITLTWRPPGLPWETELLTAQIAAPGAWGQACAVQPHEPLSLPELFLHKQTEAGEAPHSTRGHRQDEQDCAYRALCAPQNINIYEVLYYYSSFLENTRGQDKDTVNSHHLFLAKSSNDLRDYNSPYRTRGGGAHSP